MSAEKTTIRVGIENGRAQYAFETVRRFVEGNIQRDNKLKEYRSYAKKLPAMIKVNGLGQTLAFCFAKGDQYKVLYQQIYDWIKQKQPDLLEEYHEKRNMEFVEIVVAMNSNDYRIISNEVLALLDWMRRFADGMIRDQIHEPTPNGGI
ncbi:MAG: type III-B CRISPR module-associated protein Cmr5 [Desulfitobacteriaceae bacterium]|nr:type III-B CRISPR module-associated protein Cmr5 [Desulfitobacteriaceae bacterium]MDD4346641.1 type III-B CRISPR module-associated protein Cmr5 [Desulfitobacteriaceae bacterium]MDD4401601.1 type III-B CRISPR module-associated protein Cmr5 [Desulfitobacteriaceae bacterium]